MWSNVGLTTAMWDSQPRCGAMWSHVGQVVQCIHINRNKILYDRIWPKIWQQCRCPMSRTPSFSFFGNTRLAGASLLSLLSLLCCRPCAGAVKFAHYHFGLAGCFTTYLLYCDVMWCRAMSMSHRRSHAMWRNVAQCDAMSHDVGLRWILIGFLLWLLEQENSRKFHQNFCWIVGGLCFYMFFDKGSTIWH